MVYLITYDLNKPGKDYTSVYQAIKDASDGTLWHDLDSAWLIRSQLQSANDVFRYIQPHLDANDRCLVIEVKRNYQGWLPEKDWEHIRQHLFG